MKASDIMNFGVATVLADAPLGEAARTLLNHHIRSLPVVDPTGKLVGIVTESDLIRALAADQSWVSSLEQGRPTSPAAFETRRISDIMSPVVMTIDGDTSASEAIQIVAGRTLHHLPVVDGAKLRGMLSPADILSVAVDPDRRGG
jgi:CBS domain-containing protein